MKVVERFGEQANMRKKIKEYGLKFIHSNWNLNSSYNIYYDFEMIFGVFFLDYFWACYILFRRSRSKKSNALNDV